MQNMNIGLKHKTLNTETTFAHRLAQQTPHAGKQLGHNTNDDKCYLLLLRPR